MDYQTTTSMSNTITVSGDSSLSLADTNVTGNCTYTIPVWTGTGIYPNTNGDVWPQPQFGDLQPNFAPARFSDPPSTLRVIGRSEFSDLAVFDKISVRELECDSISVKSKDNSKPSLKKLMKMAWKMYELAAVAALDDIHNLNVEEMPQLYIKYLQQLREAFDV